jgi:very-short-patch-repair endonuclease
VANEQARRLRKRMTPQEVKLWVRLRKWREFGHHFRRQAPRGDYVVDFICLKSRLIVEVDGGGHAFHSRSVKDTARDRKLTYRNGFRVLRFWNNEIDRSIDAVLDAILAALAERVPSPPTALRAVPPPRSGEG